MYSECTILFPRNLAKYASFFNSFYFVGLLRQSSPLFGSFYEKRREACLWVGGFYERIYLNCIGYIDRMKITNKERDVYALPL